MWLSQLRLPHWSYSKNLTAISKDFYREHPVQRQRVSPVVNIVTCLAFWCSVHIYYQHPLPLPPPSSLPPPPGLARAEFVQFRATQILTKLCWGEGDLGGTEFAY